MGKDLLNEFNPSLVHPSYLTRKRLLDGIKQYAGNLKGILLDFGCGSKPYRSLFSVDQYIGVDFENPGHPHVNESIDFFYDGKHLPFPDEQFDAVFSSEVFEHVFNLDQIMSELNRVLKPGGKILITCPFAICEHEVPNDFARYSSYGLKHLFENKGFEIEKLEKTGNSIETVFQLQLMYIHQHIAPYFKKIPVVRSVFRLVVYTTMNLAAVFFSRILPKRKDLYLNNIVLATKLKTS